MAIRREDFRRLGIGEIWSQTLSDDLSLSRAVKRAGLRITFVPECLVASFESSTWRRLYEFGRRQFLITRVYTPGAWWLGFFGSLGSVLGLWGGLAAALYAGVFHAEHVVLYAAVPVIFFWGQIARAVLRQLAMTKTLSEHVPQLLPAIAADIFGCWLWSLVLFVLMLSSSVGRTIRWRGIRYKLVGPSQIQILEKGTFYFLTRPRRLPRRRKECERSRMSPFPAGADLLGIRDRWTGCVRPVLRPCDGFVMDAALEELEAMLDEVHADEDRHRQTRPA